jgi:hypothetical protein
MRWNHVRYAPVLWLIYWRKGAFYLINLITIEILNEFIETLYLDSTPEMRGEQCSPAYPLYDVIL